MMGRIDSLINSITMYRLVFYVLSVMAVCAFVLGFSGNLFFGVDELILSLIVLFVCCFVGNWFFARVFRVGVNIESWMITALILFLLFVPTLDLKGLGYLAIGSFVAMGSKYILALRRMHIFNPAAMAAVLLGFNPESAALWWVGTPWMLPVVMIGGLIVLRKTRKFGMFGYFLIGAIVVSVLVALNRGIGVGFDFWKEILLSTPLIFLGTIMLTEPLTTPSRRNWQGIYGLAVGILYASQFRLGPVFSTPELALVLGNVFSYVLSSRQRVVLKFIEKKKIADSIYELVFTNPGLKYVPGQYAEWTLSQDHPDSRGVRRFFTIASSAGDGEKIALGIRVVGDGSSFKKALLGLKKGEVMSVANVAGDFVMPCDLSQKLVFIAGGIGVTPFVSMARSMIEHGEKRDIVLLYFNRHEEEIAYRDIFDKASEFGLKTICCLTDLEKVRVDWEGERGRLDKKMLVKIVPDYMDRVFYLSGPNVMVDSYKKILRDVGVGRGKIKTDYFPGY